MTLTDLIAELKRHQWEKAVDVGFETFHDPNCMGGVAIRRAGRMLISEMVQCTELARNAFPGGADVYLQHPKNRRRFDLLSQRVLRGLLGPIDPPAPLLTVYVMDAGQFERLEGIAARLTVGSSVERGQAAESLNALVRELREQIP